MTAQPPISRGRSLQRRVPPRLAIGATIGIGIAALILATVHRVYVTMASRPDCVDHLKERGDPALGEFRAARPSC